MPNQRIERISEEIRREISRIIREQVKDPRIAEMASILRVDLSKDFRHAKVYVSVLGDSRQKDITMEGLNRACGYIRKELGHVLNIRYTPELHFILDDSIEYSIRIAKKIEDILAKNEENLDNDV